MVLLAVAVGIMTAPRPVAYRMVYSVPIDAAEEKEIGRCNTFNDTAEFHGVVESLRHAAPSCSQKLARLNLDFSQHDYAVAINSKIVGIHHTVLHTLLGEDFGYPDYTPVAFATDNDSGRMNVYEMDTVGNYTNVRRW